MCDDNWRPFSDCLAAVLMNCRLIMGAASPDRVEHKVCPPQATGSESVAFCMEQRGARGGIALRSLPGPSLSQGEVTQQAMGWGTEYRTGLVGLMTRPAGVLTAYQQFKAIRSIITVSMRRPPQSFSRSAVVIDLAVLRREYHSVLISPTRAT